MGRDQPADRRGNQPERPDFKTAFNRMLVRAGMNARAKIGEVAQSVADVCSQQQQPVVQPYERGQGSSKFSDLPAHAGIVKHREFGRLFNIQDPFYRSHDARTGSETWMEGRRYVNFASYDYLGLSQHPAVAEAAKAAIDRFGTSVSASRIVAGERPLHRELESGAGGLLRRREPPSPSSAATPPTSRPSARCMSPDDLIVHDELAHNSVLVGAKLSRATAHAFRHNDPRSAGAHPARPTAICTNAR